jgi:hypothetical protein
MAVPSGRSERAVARSAGRNHGRGASPSVISRSVFNRQRGVSFPDATVPTGGQPTAASTHCGSLKTAHALSSDSRSERDHRAGIGLVRLPLPDFVSGSDRRPAVVDHDAADSDGGCGSVPAQRRALARSGQDSRRGAKAGVRIHDRKLFFCIRLVRPCGLMEPSRSPSRRPPAWPPRPATSGRVSRSAQPGKR